MTSENQGINGSPEILSAEYVGNERLQTLVGETVWDLKA